MPVNLFDANFYRAANPDLAGLDDAQALSHFQTYGLNEGRAFSPFADLNFYRSNNPDLASFNNQQLYEHLQNYGVAEGRRFSLLVDVNFYRALHSDLASFNNEQAFWHLQNFGLGEGRRFSQFVDLNFYRASYSDLAGFNNSQALQHLKIYGFNEGRQFSQFFNINYYRANNPDLVAAGLNGSQLLEHFQTYGLSEGRQFSEPLDINYYRSVNFDLVAAGLNNQQLYDHFQLYGLGEGRASSPFFNVSYYLANNFDLRALSFNNFQAYDHFVLFGSQEERVARSSSFDIKFDYRFDTNGFFGGDNLYRRDSLEAAATIWEAILTDEFPDVPVGTTTPGVRNPQTGDSINFTTDALIDDLVVFVGARDLGDSTGAEGFVSGYSRNEPRYSSSSNFEPWAGSIAFDTSTQYFFDTTPNTSSAIPIENVDFISVAVHELGHILGIGTSPAFDSLVSDGFFNGPNAKALNGNNPIPLDLDLKHVTDNILIGGVESQALMEGSFTSGIQKLPTALDIALLADIGYQLPNI